MWLGTYTLDLYCDNDAGSENYPRDLFGVLADKHQHLLGEFPHQYVKESDKLCFARARKAGWVFKRDGTVLCPKCSGKRVK